MEQTEGLQTEEQQVEGEQKKENRRRTTDRRTTGRRTAEEGQQTEVLTRNTNMGNEQKNRHNTT